MREAISKGLGHYRAIYERDEDGVWIVTIAECRACHSDGRSIAQARTRIRDALSLFYEDAKRAELVDDVRLPGVTQKALKKALTARAAAERAQELASSEIRAAVRMLVDEHGLSTRDAAAVLGMSQQRIAQLAISAKRRGRAA